MDFSTDQVWDFVKEKSRYEKLAFFVVDGVVDSVFENVILTLFLKLAFFSWLRAWSIAWPLLARFRAYFFSPLNSHQAIVIFDAFFILSCIMMVCFGPCKFS